jgi:hypothetical protein|uniref:Uncharacterized protein n=1 Tax=Mantoniella tinhauana virus 1 TaxID=3111543 RepID=A0AB38ZM82_9VIRU
MLSIDDVTKIDDRRKQIRKEIYTKIYEQFTAKIKQSVEFGHKQIFLTVPTFLLGYPVFDRAAATKYITRQFVLGGFTARMLNDHDIYVSWAKANTKKKKEEKKKIQEEDVTDFPTLMNLKKMANKYRQSRKS